jgi:acetylornithine/N-succinyldiaminopimelate aminotransferase
MTAMYLSELKKLEQTYVAQTYKRADLGVESGDGVTATDVGGKALIDFSSGIGVNSIGFTNPKWVEAVKGQIDRLAHISNLYYTAPMVMLAKALCEKTGMKRVFFANSGAEANEGAIKTARKYGADKYGKERCEIVGLENSFHGRTIATLAATGQDVFHKDFGPFPAGFSFAKANDVDSLMSKVNDKTCAIMIECIQGEGGVISLNKSFTDAIAKLCAERDILLVVDEVQTGVGRTGSFVCYSQFGLKPDVVTLAKGLGGGLPIGAVLFGEKTKDTLGFGDHGSTFGGNPIVSAGALAVLDSIDGKLLDSVKEKGDYFREKLLAMKGVSAVSGKGMMLGISLDAPLTSAAVVPACIAAGLIVLSAKEKVRLLPPLTIEKAEIDAGLAIFEKVLAEQNSILESTLANHKQSIEKRLGE